MDIEIKKNSNYYLFTFYFKSENEKIKFYYSPKLGTDLNFQIKQEKAKVFNSEKIKLYLKIADFFNENNLDEEKISILYEEAVKFIENLNLDNYEKIDEHLGRAGKKSFSIIKEGYKINCSDDLIGFSLKILKSIGDNNFYISLNDKKDLHSQVLEKIKNTNKFRLKYLFERR